MPGNDRASWTTGAPKWAAVIALGAASSTAIGWAIGRGGDSWRTPARPSTPSPSAAVSSVSAQPQPRTQPEQPPAQSAAASQQQPALVQPQALAPSTPSGGTSPAPSPPATASLRKLINVNTAGQGELELLPGIGPALAKRIIEHRTSKGAFKRIDDLDAVKGIGPKILERLRPQVCVE